MSRSSVCWFSLLLAVAGTLGASACGDKDDTDSSPVAAATAWYSTCGDPVCSGYAGPFDGLAVCSAEVEGAACPTEGAECDLETECNTRLRCATEDPKSDPYGCPQSLARTKRDIQYLSPRDRAAARSALLATRLATWRYHWDADDRRPRLGFLIDDQPHSPAVQADGAHVDLYGYTSLTVAAVQAQEEELRAVRAELAQTRAELAALHAAVAELRDRTR